MKTQKTNTMSLTDKNLREKDFHNELQSRPKGRFENIFNEIRGILMVVLVIRSLIGAGNFNYILEYFETRKKISM